jgi:hypothetical protein
VGDEGDEGDGSVEAEEALQEATTLAATSAIVSPSCIGWVHTAPGRSNVCAIERAVR